MTSDEIITHNTRLGFHLAQSGSELLHFNGVIFETISSSVFFSPVFLHICKF